MSDKLKNLTKWISQAGQTQRVVEFQFPHLQDFYVRIAYASKFNLNQIREACRESFVNRRGITEDRLNEEKMRKEYAERIVKGWRGLTIGRLNKLVPGILEIAVAEMKGTAVEEIEKIEVEYDQDTTRTILNNSIEFENWMIDMATNVENFTKIAEQKEKEFENLV